MFVYFLKLAYVYSLHAGRCTIMQAWIVALSTLPRNHLRAIFFFCNVVSVYMYLNRCICIYILCVSPEEGFYDYLLVHAVIDCERSLIFVEPMA